MESDAEAIRGSVHSSEWDQGIQVMFQMDDGTFIFQDIFAPAIPVAALKQRVLAEWPQDREVIPESLDDIRLQIEGEVLEDSQTLADCARSSSIRVGDLITVIAAVNVRGEIQDTTEQTIELKFRLSDETDICHDNYPSSTTVVALKKMLIAEWPKEIQIIPESVNGLVLLLGANFLENSMTLAECRSEYRHHFSDEVITVHAVVIKGKERKTSRSCCEML